jgi:hypothetical protein
MIGLSSPGLRQCPLVNLVWGPLRGR